MEELLIFIVLLVTGCVIFKWSYNYLWFKVALLFADITQPLNKNVKFLSTQLAELNEKSVKDNFMHKFYTEYSVSSQRILRSMRILFSFSMACYILTIEIVLWQIKTSDQEQTADFITKFVWPMLSMLLSLILILIQPFFILITLLNKFFDDRFDIDRLIIITSGVLISLISTLAILNVGPFRYTSNILTRLSISGVTIMALLSGIASVSTVYYTIFFLLDRLKKHKPTISTNYYATGRIQNRKFLLWNTDTRLREKLEYYKYHIQKDVEQLKMIDQNKSDYSNIERNTLMENVALNQFEYNQLESFLKGPPLIRYLKKSFEVIFLIYCFHKILFTFFLRIPRIILHLLKFPDDDLFQNFSHMSDPLAITVAKFLDFCLFRFNYQHDLDSLTSQISLFLSASLFICSFSTVNTTISFMSTLLPVKFQTLTMFAMRNSEDIEALPTYRGEKHQKNPSLIKNLLVSELAGIYVVATILMIRSNLPFDISSKLKVLLGEKFTVPSIAIDCWFDEVYALSCILTLTSIKLAERTVFNTGQLNRRIN